MLTLILSTVVLASPSPATPLYHATASASSTTAAEDLATIDGEYAAALTTWEEACAGVRSKRHRPPHPDIEFFPRYRALSEGGTGAAIPWLVSHAKEAGIKLVERRKLIPDLLNRAFSEHRTEPWMEDTFFALVDARKLMDKDQALAWCRELAAVSPPATPHGNVRATALFAQAQLLSNAGREKDAGLRAQASALMLRTAQEYPDSLAAASSVEVLFDILADEYEGALRASRSGTRAGGGGVDGASTPSQPAVDVTPRFWARFSELAELGSGHGRLWLLTHVQASGLGGVELKALKLKLMEGLTSSHANEPWLIAVASEAAEIAKPDALQETVVILERWASSVSSRTDQAHILLGLARAHFEVGNKNEAIDLLKKVMRYHADTELAWEAEDMMGTYTAPRVGEEAPDFTTTDVDGEEMVLSSQRGKVVLLNFWGFW